MNICVVSFIISKAFQTPLRNLISVLQSDTHTISVLYSTIEQFEKTSNTYPVKWKKIPFTKPKHILLYGFMYMLLQIRIAYSILNQSKDIDTYLFFMEGVGLLPMIAVKLLNKQIIWMLPSSILMAHTSKKKIGSYFIFKYSQSICARLSTLIILYSKNLISVWNLERYVDKIRFAHEHYLDFSQFNNINQYNKRKPVIGHIGRLSDEKGTMNFIKAIPKILEEEKNVHFFIGGDGPLANDILQFIHQNNLQDYITYSGWIKHDLLPEYLNDLKLLVITSLTEGLPNLMIEAMACGTPVVATPVGSIPDVITDESTGFIISQNTPEQIKNDVLRALTHSNIETISLNAQQFIKQTFNYEITIEQFQQVLLVQKNENLI
jgi:glycosyltransferase involved in cell wall biosynthesis